MSSPYPILDNKPIDQWRVAELKEELKRRKLTTKGLKDDLVKRLSEAIRIERENAVAEVDDGFNLSSQPVVGVNNAMPVHFDTETAKVGVAYVAEKNVKANDARVQIDINDSVEDEGQGNLQEVAIMGIIDSSGLQRELPVHATTMDAGISVTENLVSQGALGGEDAQIPGAGEVKVNSNIQMEMGSKPSLGNLDPEPQAASLDPGPQVASLNSGPQLGSLNVEPQLGSLSSEPQLDIEKSEPQLENEKSEPQLENDGLKPTDEDVMLDCTAPNNQVSEVSANLGFQVKSDSISTDSVSINEKIELKDNIIADNVQLEQDDVKPEMVEPSSINVVPVGGESHPMDVEEPLEKKASVEERDDNNNTNTDVGEKNDLVDVGYSEKLNLDRSSGDDSMEEDILESRQIDSKDNSDDVGDRNEKIEIPVAKEENLIDIVGNDSSFIEKEIRIENDSRTTVPAEKRKLNDQETVGNMEPLKRRRWNSESLKEPDRQGSSLTPITTPKDAFQPTPLRHSFSRSNSSVSEDAPKERIVPQSLKPPTNSLRIDRFLRPFTLKAVQEFLGKTGTITSFWMDQIKTHCYVTYSSVEKAVETRNAVYNLQWPPNGGRNLIAEFVDPLEVKMKLEAPPQSPAAPVTPSTPASAPPSLQLQPSPRQPVSRQQLPPPPALPPPPPLSNPPVVREQLAHPERPPIVERNDPPIVTLDDLFRKTKATPRIYYLPLSDEQVAVKLAERGKNTKQ